MPTETFGKSKVRKDLGEMVAGMKPSFVRFPGGCFVEGDTLAQRFNGKTSLGEASKRGKNQCLWGYSATNGMGYHEYLQWCRMRWSTPTATRKAPSGERSVPRTATPSLSVSSSSRSAMRTGGTLQRALQATLRRAQEEVAPDPLYRL